MDANRWAPVMFPSMLRNCVVSKIRRRVSCDETRQREKNSWRVSLPSKHNRAKHLRDIASVLGVGSADSGREDQRNEENGARHGCLRPDDCSATIHDGRFSIIHQWAEAMLCNQRQHAHRVHCLRRYEPAVIWLFVE